MKRYSTILTLALIAAFLGLAGCSESLSDSGPKFQSNCPWAGIYVATSDYTVGASATLSGSPPINPCRPKSEISSDPVARYYDGRIFVVNRFGFDNIQILNPYKDLKTIKQYSTGNGSNPQDIAFASPMKAFISVYGNDKLLIVNPRGGKSLGNVDLSAYADVDGLPEPAKMLVVKDRLFVAIQRLDSANWFAPTVKSMMAVIDTVTDQVVTAVDLATTNPVTDLIYDPVNSKIYVGCAGAFKAFGNPADDGAIESISVDIINDVYTVDPVLFSEATLGGDVSAMAMVSSTQAYAMISDGATNHLVRFDPSNTVAGTTEIWNTTSWIQDMALDPYGYLYVADGDFVNPGVRVWDTLTDTQVSGGAIDVGLPPVNFAVIQ